MLGSVTRSARRRKWQVGGLTFVLAALALVVVGYRWYLPRTANHLSPAQVPPLGPAATTIVPGVHLLGGLAPSAAYVVETSEGLVLIDSGLKSDAGPLNLQMAELGLDSKRLRAILLTHTHGDHCGGAQYLRAATGAKVYAGAGDAEVLRAGEPREAFFSTYYMPHDSPHRTTVDVELKGDEVIAFGDVRFRALATPGHTPGSLCYLMERGNLRALFAGDVIMMLLGDEKPRSEKRKPLGTYSAYLAPGYRGNARDYLASLQKLRSLPVPDLILPGHPSADPTPQNPCLSQERWEGLLDAGIRDMQTLLARYEKDGADFLDDHAKALLPELYYFGDLQGAAVYGLFASSQFYLIDAPGGPGLVEFLDARQRLLGMKPAAPAAVLLTSCGPEATAGLSELVDKYHVQVVAAPAGLPRVKELCPAGTVVLSAEDLPKQGWFPVTPIPLGGRGLAPIAYRVSWAKKSVLFSGQIPIMLNRPATEALFSELSQAKEKTVDYLRSIIQLGKVKPHLWLPAHPSDAQNANIYDSEWEQILAGNWGFIESNRSLWPERR
ncbi:MAG TPA: MBL fold metallo-hydrolase [Isosphaeraceae bacterium]|jgi:glyoxylase-like metal-dependent hydrolase (beta-lactamase superfamily II)|nr:MBL fold metallo-hydrolase [Isosphaeraceae bacterium]